MKKLLFLLLTACTLLMYAQEKKTFYDDIQHFKKLNTHLPPARTAILFLGSSSFTMWQDVNDYFPGKTIINRGFGGSSLADLNYYSRELLSPYRPKQIVIYCGENDFASHPALKPKEVLKRFKTFYKTIRTYDPNIDVSYISTKMSPSREALWPKFEETNLLIKKFLSARKNTHYIDITKGMQDAEGKVRTDLFLEDQLHLKPEGYAIWAKIIDPYLQ